MLRGTVGIYAKARCMILCFSVASYYTVPASMSYCAGRFGTVLIGAVPIRYRVRGHSRESI